MDVREQNDLKDFIITLVCLDMCFSFLSALKCSEILKKNKQFLRDHPVAC